MSKNVLWTTYFPWGERVLKCIVTMRRTERESDPVSGPGEAAAGM